MARLWFLVAIALTLLGVGPAMAQKRGERLSVEQTEAMFTNMTHMVYDDAHGTQIEYLGKRGVTYLFYPGNKVVVRGEWLIAHGNNSMPVAICFTYEANTYNPVTGERGGRLECQNAVAYAKGIVDRAKGDVFGLAETVAVPFQLSRKQTTIARLKEQHP